MSFQWLTMRIAEEQERREREAQIRARLPRALDEFHQGLSECVENYCEAFGAESAVLDKQASRIQIVVREEQDGQWQQLAKVDIALVLSVPGFEISNGGDPPVIIEVGMLPGDKLFYKDREKDQYIGIDQLTHLTLDRVLFPKLRA